MSKILWSKLLAPELTAAPAGQARALAMEPYVGEVADVIAYPVDSQRIAIPDPKALRSMSRASVFLSHVCAAGAHAFAPMLESSPYSVGIYCAVDNGPIDAPSTARIIATGATGIGHPDGDAGAFSEAYRKARNPKMYLKQLPNLAPAQMGISLGIRGPMNVYTHSTAGAIQALEQAEWDLRAGCVRAALVCSAHAFDDFLVVRRTRSQDPRCLVEAAAALMLVPDADGGFVDWSRRVSRDPAYSFGIADPLVSVLRDPAYLPPLAL